MADWTEIAAIYGDPCPVELCPDTVQRIHFDSEKKRVGLCLEHSSVLTVAKDELVDRRRREQRPTYAREQRDVISDILWGTGSSNRTYTGSW